MLCLAHTTLPNLIEVRLVVRFGYETREEQRFLSYYKCSD